jgi:hypothetical protein
MSRFPRTEPEIAALALVMVQEFGTVRARRSGPTLGW